MEHEAFVERILSRLPAAFSGFYFDSWQHGGRPTKEGFAMMKIAGVDPAKVMDAVMDVDHYVGNIDHVTACRSIADPRFVPPEKVRFYQKLSIPIIGAIHHELVLHRLGSQQGYDIAAWGVLRSETDALSSRDGFRSDYNHGAWIAGPGMLGYALGSAPKRDDVGFLKWKAMTKGADAAAARVLKANLEVVARWAACR